MTPKPDANDRERHEIVSRLLTEYKWRYDQVIQGYAYPGRRQNKGDPDMGKRWWGFAKTSEGKYVLGRGRIVGRLYFRDFLIVRPLRPVTKHDYRPADFHDIRELHIDDEDTRNWIEPHIGMPARGFYQDPIVPDVLRTGVGIITYIHTDYYFCFVEPVEEGKDVGKTLRSDKDDSKANPRPESK
ncbi:hypothetical protein BJY01DRAFT_244888 [Aspergillus pseudoustus]|uniref:Uncharacterized protein n=1 Tax=Aspergillus pseudoustus TaxID=1810923 RepID=A0ABR4KH15_9EURO